MFFVKSPASRLAATKAVASFSASASSTYDTIVIGGGVVGSALACGLATAPALAGSKVGIVEAAPPKPFEEVVDMVSPDAVDVRL